MSSPGIITKSRELANTFNLPRGEKIRREQVAVFRRQRAAINRYLKTGKKDDYDSGLPNQWPTWDDFGLGALKLSERFTPLLRVHWQDGGSKLFSRVGLDPDEWSVTNPHTAEMIAKASLDFCTETQNTTSLTLDAALKKTREELTEGIVKRGESLAKLTQRVNAIFDGAEKWKARQIAASEASRAVHAAGEQAAIESEVVTGWEWLLSSDACPLCQTVARRCPKVKLGQPFAVIGGHPEYSKVKFPPLHPECQCTVIEVLDTDEQPKWSDTLMQPKPEAQDIPEDLKPKPKPTPEPRPNKPESRKPTPKPRPRKPLAKPVPPWMPGDPPIDTSLPIGERIKLATHLDAKVKAIAGIRTEVEQLREAQKRADAELNAYYESMKGSKLAAGPMLDGLVKHEKAARDATTAVTRHMLGASAKASGFISLPQGSEEFAWRHHGRDLLPRPTQGAVSDAESWLKGKFAADGSASPKFLWWKMIPKGQDQRANANQSNDSINLTDKNTAGTAVHEWGHHIEFFAKGAGTAAREFLDHRVGDETPRKLRDLFPKGKYDNDEYGREDDFGKAFGDRAKWYVGKKYPSGDTEIISMGLQRLHEDPVDFASKDPEYCKFMLGVLDGSLRSP